MTADAPGSGTPTGSVLVTDDDNGSAVCVGTIAAGSCSMSIPSAGTHHLHAMYLGDANFLPSAPSAAATHTVNPASTITAVLSDTPDPSAPGQTVTVTYLVAVAAPGVGTPSGNVVVTDADSAATCTATVAAGQCTLTLNAPGAHHLTATYVGNADFNGSASVAADHQVGQASTTAAITTDTPDPSVVGQSVPVAYSVAVVAPGSGTPTGNVVVTDADSAATCTATVAAGQCALTFTSTGTHHLRATYQGDSNFLASAPSAVENHTVNAASTATTVTADTPDPSLTGQNVTVSYSVTPVAPGAGTPTGSVFVTDDDSLAVCSGTVAAGSCQVTLAAAGTHHLHATYLGDANFLASATSAAALHTVNGVPTVSSIVAADASPTNAASVHWTVTFSAPVSGVDAGDFQLVNTGLGGVPAITSVTPAGPATTYTVTASTGSGAGTLGLNLVDNDSIVDGSSTPLGGPGAGNGNATGSVYSLDLVAPSVSINQAVGQADPTNVSPVTFSVVFSESVSDFTGADVTVGGTSTHGVASVTGSGTTYTVTVPVSASGTVVASVAAGTAHDAVGNANTASTSSDDTVTYATAVAADGHGQPGRGPGGPDQREPGELHGHLQLVGERLHRRRRDGGWHGDARCGVGHGFGYDVHGHGPGLERRHGHGVVGGGCGARRLRHAEHGVDVDRQHGDVRQRRPERDGQPGRRPGGPDEHEPGELHRGVQRVGERLHRHRRDGGWHGDARCGVGHGFGHDLHGQRPGLERRHGHGVAGGGCGARRRGQRQHGVHVDRQLGDLHGRRSADGHGQPGRGPGRPDRTRAR